MSIRAKGGDRWQVIAELGTDAAGARRRVTRIVHGTLADARRVEAELAKQAAAVTPDGAKTVESLLRYWLWQKPGRLKASTIAEYRRLALKRIIPALGHHKLHALRPGHCAQLYDDLADDLGANTIRRVHSVLSRAFSLAIRWGWVMDNPVRRAEPPAEVRHRVVVPTDDQVFTLLDVADRDDRYGMGVAMRVAVMAGLRRGEILALGPDSVEGSDLVVSRAVSEIRGQRNGPSSVVGDTKTHQARVVPIPKPLQVALESWTSEVTSRIDGRPEFLFSARKRHERPWTPSAFSRRWGLVQAEAGQPVRFHDLRHWFATTALDDGTPETTVAAMLGHESTATLQRVYAHRVESTARSASDKLGDRFG